MVVDGGKEFESVYFKTLFSRATNAQENPASRQGPSLWLGLLERVFGTTNTQLIYNLMGNTHMTGDVVMFLGKSKES